jgi:hypothetical protein
MTTHIFAASVIATLMSTPRPDSSFSQSCRGRIAVGRISSRLGVFGGILMIDGQVVKKNN